MLERKREQTTGSIFITVIINRRRKTFAPAPVAMTNQNCLLSTIQTWD
jgi:hypothetical protein